MPVNGLVVHQGIFRERYHRITALIPTGYVGACALRTETPLFGESTGNCLLVRYNSPSKVSRTFTTEYLGGGTGPRTAHRRLIFHQSLQATLARACADMLTHLTPTTATLSATAAPPAPDPPAPGPPA